MVVKRALLCVLLVACLMLFVPQCVATPVDQPLHLVFVDKLNVGQPAHSLQDAGGPKCGNKPEGCPACFICNFSTGACVADENCKGPVPNQDAKHPLPPLVPHRLFW